jgi:hypothetical protein
MLCWNLRSRAVREGTHQSGGTGSMTIVGVGPACPEPL